MVENVARWDVDGGANGDGGGDGRVFPREMLLSSKNFATNMRIPRMSNCSPPPSTTTTDAQIGDETHRGSPDCRSS